MMEEAKGRHDHAAYAETFNQDTGRVNWHDETLWFVRAKRDRAAAQVAGWESLRDMASQIKSNVLDNLREYLISFERNALQNGVHVHWASTPEELNRTVLALIDKSGERKIVKSKSMLTEECGLNPYLEANGIEVIDTDLGERIVQLAEEHPSHIVLPCIHKKKEEIGQLFHKHLGTPEGSSDPVLLTGAARIHLRQHFLTSKVAITGVNFAIAETGEIVVCTNEGNADLGVQLSDMHIACMGIEKIIPRRSDLGVFLRLLARSATGQPITTYSSHFRRPRSGQQMHIVLLDNGRAERLSEPDFRSALKCIRCGACMNTCPVYRRSGGHSYHSTIAGPIGSILAPALDMQKYADLPFASTLCGSCSNVCPVKIDIHNQLYKWRQVIVRKGYADPSKKTAMKIMSRVLATPMWYSLSGRFVRGLMRILPSAFANSLNVWTKNREMPAPPRSSFLEWYKKNGQV
jgi:L-lactate dehydrogenase complex protein LldF